MLRLAVPLVAAEVGWMLMGVVDTIMVGHLPDAALAMSSAALAQILFNTVAFGMGGILLGLDTVLAQAHGADEIPQANRWLLHGVLLAIALAAVLTGLFLLAPSLLPLSHADPRVLARAVPTLEALNAGVLPLLLYFALRRYLQAFHHGRAIAATLIAANGVNVLFNWLLIYSHRWQLGPGWTLAWQGRGVVGSGVATTLARSFMALCLLAAIAWYNRRNGYALERTPRRPEWASMLRLLRLGVPAGATILVEITIFAVVTFLIARLGAVPLAGHEVALNCVSFTFMLPLGLSAAAAVRVGQEIGRGDLRAARAAGWVALALAAAVMLVTAALYLLVPHGLARLFTPDPAVIRAAVPLFGVAAIFQVCDGLQVTAMGALRGAGDTLSGLIIHTATYWLTGLPLGIFLAFHRGLGARGLWLGLSAALVLAGFLLLWRWHRVSRSLLLPSATG